MPETVVIWLEKVYAFHMPFLAIFPESSRVWR